MTIDRSASCTYAFGKLVLIGKKKKLFKKKSFFENSTRTFDEISNAFRSTKTVIDQNMQEVLLSTWTKWLDLKLCSGW